MKKDAMSSGASALAAVVWASCVLVGACSDGRASSFSTPPAATSPTTTTGADADASASPNPSGGGGESTTSTGGGAMNDAGAGSGGSDAASAHDASAPALCPKATTLATDGTVSLTHAGVARTYVVHVGRAVKPGVAAPLLVNVHGLNNSPAIQSAFSQVNPLADTEGFIVAYPTGLNSSFNAGSCCGTSSQNGVDDIGFMRAIVADVEGKACVDASRVYAMGFSNGGYMANRLACEASDLFAAVGIVSGADGLATCTPSRAVPVISFHGSIDTIVPYADGKALSAGWVSRDGCTGEAVHTVFGASSCDAWNACRDGAKVEMCTITGGWHLWPDATTAIPATPAIWSFLKQFTL